MTAPGADEVRCAQEERMWAERDRAKASENTRPASVEDLWPSFWLRDQRTAVDVAEAA
jgi:hypothetical protein